MTCPSCSYKQTLSEEEIDLLIDQQLRMEVDLVSEVIRNERLSVCDNCSFVVQHTCAKCGCFIKFRASLNNKQCPENKW